MNAVNNWLIHRSQKYWFIFLVFVLFQGTLVLLLLTTERFRQTTAGLQPFDMQTGLSLAAMQAQLPAYTPESVRLYAQFTLIDLVFPLLAGLFLALVLAALLSANPAGWAMKLLSWKLPVWAFAATLLDWLENLFMTLTVRTYPPKIPALMQLAWLANRFKFAWLAFLGALALLLLVALLWSWARRSRTQAQSARR